jgi:iron complex outermembrane recepter protein
LPEQKFQILLIKYNIVQNKFISLLLCFLFPNCITAQVKEGPPCDIKAYIIDKETGNSIPNAALFYTVSDNTVIMLYSKADGYFEITDFKSQSISIHIPGYKDELLMPDDFCNRICFFYAECDAQTLPAAQVTGFKNESTSLSVPASIGTISSGLLQQTDRTSLQNAFNTIPGVSFESRGYGGSSRINIRGSALRSPTAVRNIKMYLEGIPLTSPDGQSPLELIDANDIASVEVIKGPAGSVWGSGNGGVLLIKPQKANVGSSAVKVGGMAGAYGILRQNTSIEVGLKKTALRLSYNFQRNNGYRAQESNNKNQINLFADHYINEKHKLFFYGTYYEGSWDLPGSLNSTQVNDNPRQAVQFSIDNNAHVWRKRLMSGVSHRWHLTSKLTAETAVYYYHTDKENPYGTSVGNNGFKDELADGTGLRTNWTYAKNLNENNSVKVNFGGEIQNEKYSIQEYKLSNAQRGDFKYQYNVNFLNWQTFVSADWKLLDRLIINTGVSVTQSLQKVEGNNSSAFIYDTTASWKVQFLPRIAASYAVNKALYLFAGRSYGNSNPTIFEMVDYENNQYNLKLLPENGVNDEIGVKMDFIEKQIQIEVNYYRYQLTNAILAQVDSVTEATVYRNTGSTKQSGIEWRVIKNWKFNKSGMGLKIWSAGTISNYLFKEYNIAEISYKDKKIPGVPQATSSNGLSISFKEIVGLDVMHYWYDKAPLNNQNSAWSNPYHLINIQGRGKINFNKHLILELYAGLNNILDTQYSSFYQLNSGSSKFYNPSPRRNFYGGFQLSFKFANRS